MTLSKRTIMRSRRTCCCTRASWSIQFDQKTIIEWIHWGALTWFHFEDIAKFIFAKRVKHIYLRNIPFPFYKPLSRKFHQIRKGGQILDKSKNGRTLTHAVAFILKILQYSSATRFYIENISHPDQSTSSPTY